MYNFDVAPDRKGTDSIKWNFQASFGGQGDLLPFWIADTDFATLPEITEAIRERCQHPCMGYAEYDQRVLQAVQGWFGRRHGWTPPLDAMFLSGGVVTGIMYTLQALTQPGDSVVVMTPVYDAFFGAIENAGRKRVECPMLHQEGRYLIDFEGMEALFQQGARVLLLCNPHNPVGRVWTREELEKLSDLCAAYKVFILSDEVHADITFPGHPYTAMGLFPQNLDRLVVYTAITKTFNMAGLCSSCLIIPNEEVRAKVQGALYGAWLFGPTSLAFPAIEAAYTHGDKWVDEQNAYLKGNAEYVCQQLAPYAPAVRVTALEGTFLMWLDFTELGTSSEALCRRMVDEYKLALGKGSAYGAAGDGFMRFNIGCTRATLEQGVSRIQKLLENWKGVKES